MELLASQLEQVRGSRVFPLFQLSIDFFASPSVYTPGAFLPSISAVFFPSSLFLFSSLFFLPSSLLNLRLFSIRSNFHPPFFAGKSAERNFRWLIIFFQFGSEELLDDYRYVRSSVKKRCHCWFFFLFFFFFSLCNIIFHPRRRYHYIDSRDSWL